MQKQKENKEILSSNIVLCSSFTSSGKFSEVYISERQAEFDLYMLKERNMY